MDQRTTQYTPIDLRSIHPSRRLDLTACFPPNTHHTQEAMLRPRGGKPPKHTLPRLLNRHQQSALAIRVIAAFLLIAVVLVAAFIPHGGLGLMGRRRDAGAGAVLEKRMAPAAPAGTKGPAAAAPVVGGGAKPGVTKV